MAKTLIIIAGPTATGKTSLAISLAKGLHTEIISADSRQCYRELNIGVGRPSAEQLAAVPHHFIASHSITDQVTAITFEQYALATLDRIFENAETAVVAGGTGLYLKALTDGLDLIPDIPPDIREKIIEDYESVGLGWLQETIEKEDPYFYAHGENKNPHRLMRALEVMRGTGKSILSFKSNSLADRGFRILKYNLVLSKPILHKNISERVDKMVEDGLFDEVRSLMPFEHLQALQTVGYKEIFEFYHGNTTKDEAVQHIKTHTRQYAKRQMTWFKKDSRFITLNGEAPHQDLVVRIDQDLQD